MGKIFPVIIFATFLTLSLNITQTDGLAHAATSSNNLRVVDPNGSIQRAINEAAEGETILVKSGTYREYPIIVNKTLTIIGESMEDSILDGEGAASIIFLITANNVIIKNFTIRNTNKSDKIRGTAIRIFKSTNVQINKVTAKNNYVGVEFLSTNFAIVARCKIFEGVWGIYIHDKSANNVFFSNTIANNSIGIYIPDLNSRYNKFYHNNFINNTNQVSSFSINYFDMGYPYGGNHWSNHIKKDFKYGINQSETGSDGIVDIAYNEGGANDRYPLTYPLITLEIIVGEKTFEIEVSTNSTIKNCMFSIEKKNLKIFFNGLEGTSGSCRISIPKELLSCKTLQDWNISLFGERLNYLALEDTERTYLYFTYVQLDNIEIEIIGTNAIPEFSNNLTIMIAVFTTVLLVILRFVQANKNLANSKITSLILHINFN